MNDPIYLKPKISTLRGGEWKGFILGLIALLVLSALCGWLLSLVKASAVLVPALRPGTGHPLPLALAPLSTPMACGVFAFGLFGTVVAVFMAVKHAWKNDRVRASQWSDTHTFEIPPAPAVPHVMVIESQAGEWPGIKALLEERLRSHQIPCHYSWCQDATEAELRWSAVDPVGAADTPAPGLTDADSQRILSACVKQAREVLDLLATVETTLSDDEREDAMRVAKDAQAKLMHCLNGLLVRFGIPELEVRFYWDDQFTRGLLKMKDGLRDLHEKLAQPMRKEHRIAMLAREHPDASFDELLKLAAKEDHA